MKLPLLLTALLIGTSSALAAKLPPLEFTSGHELTLINKLLPTPRRYARVDTLKYDGFTDYQRRDLVQLSAGLALTFETNSDCIYANIKFIQRQRHPSTPDMSAAGLDLYIKGDDGRWIYAGNNCPRKSDDETFSLVKDMKPGNKECLLYLPTRSIIDSVNIGVTPGCYVRPIENPFKNRIVFWGSSYTHGVSSARAGSAYPLQFERATGLETPVLGVSGNSKLQQSFARVLADTPADAFVFDAFSNAKAPELYKRFDSFMKTLREKHPTTPVIFIQTIYRENRNFDQSNEATEAAKQEAARQLVSKAMETDPNVYFVVPDVVLDNEETADGIHPSDLGYRQWMLTIKPQILEILAKYNIHPAR